MKSMNLLFHAYLYFVIFYYYHFKLYSSFIVLSVKKSFEERSDFQQEFVIFWRIRVGGLFKGEHVFVFYEAIMH